MEEQFETWILKSFDPMTQELYRHHPATIHTQAIEKLIWLIPVIKETRIQNQTPQHSTEQTETFTGRAPVLTTREIWELLQQGIPVEQQNLWQQGMNHPTAANWMHLGDRHLGQIKQQPRDQLRRPNKAAAPRSTEKESASTASELTRRMGAGNERKIRDRVGKWNAERENLSTEHMPPRNRIAEEPASGTQRFGCKIKWEPQPSVRAKTLDAAAEGPSGNRETKRLLNELSRAGAVTERTKTEAQQHRGSEAVTGSDRLTAQIQRQENENFARAADNSEQGRGDDFFGDKNKGPDSEERGHEPNGENKRFRWFSARKLTAH
jgi:hypothetical protein